MATIREPTPEEVAAWNAWVAARPEAIRKVAERFQPWKLYRLASSGHRVTLIAFSEQADGKVTMQVAVTGKFNRVAFERRVFGIDPDDLAECDLPAPEEKLGSLDLDPHVAFAMMRAGEIRETDVRRIHPGYLLTGCFGDMETPEA